MEDTKKCPYCGEEILAVAKKCKHCGEWLDDSHNRKEDDQTEISEEAHKNKLWKFGFYTIAFALGIGALLIKDFQTEKSEDSSLTNFEQNSTTQEAISDKSSANTIVQDNDLDSEYAVISDSMVTFEDNSGIIDYEYMLGKWITTESSQANGYYLSSTEETTFFNDGSSISYATIDCYRGFQIIGVTREKWSISQNLLTSTTIDYNFSCNVTSENADLELAEY